MWHGLDHLGVRERTSGAPSTPCRMRSHRFHRCFLFAPVVAHLLLIGGVMTPRTQHAPPASQPLTRRSSLARGSSAARERWIAPHDPTLRERLEVAAAHLRLARRAAGSGLDSWLLRREVEFADREILLARRTLKDARTGTARHDGAQARMLDRVSWAAAELQRSTRAAARLLDEPGSTRR